MQRSRTSSIGATRTGKVISRKKKLRYLYSRQVGMSMMGFLRVLQDRGDDFVFKKTMFGGEVIMGTTKFVLSSPVRRRNMKDLFLFSMVKRDVEKWARGKKIRKIKEAPQHFKNKARRLKKNDMVASDIDSAYWEIAKKLKMISKGTYERGLEINNKDLMLATLATLGRDKTYNMVKAGSLTNDIIRVDGDKMLQYAYQVIRNTCYRYMMGIAEMLGSDFLEYRTDCVFFYYTKKNVKLIKDFFDSKKVSYKFSDKVPEELYE